MSFQHDYPYGDVHEMNLDWLIQTMQEFINSERAAGNTPTVASVRSFFTHKYPYGDIHELNLDWVIQTALRMEEIGDSVEGDIGELQTRMTAAETNISTLDNTVGGLSDSIGQIESEIEEIQDDVSSLETTVGQHTTQIAALDQKIDEQVVANPADGATDTLSKIEIAGTVYTVEGSGGSEVEANPTGTPTDTLETIGIDGTIYEVGGSEPVSKTVTGNPINITDAADAPIISGEVTFEPKQDLHGYDKPWVGGAGKNKFEVTATTRTINGVTFTVNQDGTIRVNGTAPADVRFQLRTNNLLSLNAGRYILNGTPATGGASTYRIVIYNQTAREYLAFDNGAGAEFIISETSELSVFIDVMNGVTIDDITFYPMIRLATETDPTFEPYSNICPITGYDDCEVEVTDDATSPTVTNTYTIDLDGTRYGGTVDLVSGVMTVTQGYIATYAGETIGEPWISDRDEYVAGTTPSTGAEVVYTLATPTTVQLTPEQIRTLEGTNNISTNMTGMSLEYITQDYQPLVELIEQSVGHHYSTQERVVGTWFGKPLYEKVVDFGALPNATSKSVAHNISNLDIVCFVDAIANNGSGAYIPVPFVSTSGLQYQLALTITSSDIVINSGDNFTNYSAFVTLKYTKTTD